MPRKIAFRAWDKKLEEWIPQDKLMMMSLNYITDGDFLLEQFTGLKDKNGIEIFEGDLVNKALPYLVQFRSGRFCLRHIIKGIEHLYEFPIDEDNEDKLFKYEIIGNIHSNPELLNP